MQDRTGLTVFLVRVVFVLFETRRFCKVARFVFPDLYTARGEPGRKMEELPEYPCYFLGKWILAWR